MNAKTKRLIQYGAETDKAYSGKSFPGGYQTICDGNSILPGQRNCEQRLRTIGVEFAGKVVLDVGCNQGGMLFPLAGQIEYGYGVDHDTRLVNVCHKLRQTKRCDNLNFFVLDLQEEPLDLLDDLVEHTIDVCFFLSMCAWLSNWREVVDFCRLRAKTVIVETNGEQAEQEGQLDYMRTQFATVRIVACKSIDDPTQRVRKCVVCTR